MPFQFRKEAIEEDLNTNFPSQGQGNPPLYYSLSEVVVPTYSINNVAEGTSLPEYLQSAWDFSTNSVFARFSTVTVANVPGFWQVDLNCTFNSITSSGEYGRVYINDGLTIKEVWKAEAGLGSVSGPSSYVQDKFVVFLRTGDTLSAQTSNTNIAMDVWSRQVADANGNLINPLGFSFA